MTTTKDMQRALDAAMEVAREQIPGMDLVFVGVYPCDDDGTKDVSARATLLPAEAAEILDHAAKDFRSNRVRRVQ